MLVDTTWVQNSFNTFWAKFGIYLTVPMVPDYYILMLIISLISFGGVIAKLRDKLKNGIKIIKKYPIYVGLFSSIALSFMLDLIYSHSFDYQPQGRYLYPALIPIIILASIGIDYLIPDKWKSIVYKLLVLTFAAYNIIAIVDVLYVTYYIV